MERWSKSELFFLVLLLAGLSFGFSKLQYQPTVVAAPGHTLAVPTQPSNPLSSAWKQLYDLFELGSPCSYELLGWSEENEVFYEAACGPRTEVWMCRPKTGTVESAERPSTLIRHIAPDGEQGVRYRDHDTGAAMETEEGMFRNMVLRDHDPLLSPDGEWVALIATHIYGPEDVIVVDAP